MQGAMIIAMLGLAAASAAEPQVDKRCEVSPKRDGQCFVVNGRLYASNGGPGYRIYKLGTHRVLGVFNHYGQDIDPTLPLSVTHKLPGGALGFDHYAYGNYTVCPFSKERKGAMRFVCIAAVGNLTLTKSRSFLQAEKPR